MQPELLAAVRNTPVKSGKSGDERKALDVENSSEAAGHSHMNMEKNLYPGSIIVHLPIVVIDSENKTSQNPVPVPQMMCID